MMFSREDDAYSKPLEPTASREAAAMESYESGTFESIGANLRQGFGEMGFNSLVEGFKVRAKEAYGEPIDENSYKSSPSFRKDIPYYKGMTKQSAEALARYNDDKQTRQLITDKAPTIGIGTVAFIAGSVFEPINLISGVATMGMSKPLLATKMLSHIANKSRLAARAGAYGTEGLVAATLAEPANRYGANMLRQDYTMADSAMNIVSSTILSAGLGVGGKLLEDRAARKSAVKVFEQKTQELDLAVKQMAIGQKIDVEPVAKISEGSISKKPIKEQAAVAESFVKYTETPEFKTRFEGSKIVDPEGKPLMVYHGTYKDFDKFDPSYSGESTGQLDFGEGMYFIDNPKFASGFAGESQGANVRPVYLKGKNLADNNVVSSLEVQDAIDDDMGFVSVRELLQEKGYDGVAYKHSNGAIEYVVFSPDQVISAFGADDLPSISRRIDSENTEAIRQAAIKANDPLNDTAIDLDAANLADKYDLELQAKTDDIIMAEQRINDLKEQGLLDMDDLATLEALSEFNPKDYMSALDAAYICMTRG